MDTQRIGNALAGFSAGVSGQLPQWQQGRALEAERAVKLDEERRQQLLMANRGILVDLQAGRVEDARAQLEAARPLGGAEVDRIAALIDGGDTQSALAEMSHLDKRAVAMGMMKPMPGTEDSSARFAGSESYVDEAGNYFIATRVADPTTGETRSALAPVGHSEAQQGRVRPVNSLGLTADQIPGQKAAEASAVASATAQVEMLTMPQLRGAVKSAEEAATAAAKANEKQKTGQGAYAVWETGMSGLIEAFDKTLTGPVVGWLPALTTNQQIAVGATAAIAPVLKQLFRASGEGVFTDKDQQLLLDMAPTRKDSPEAAAWKIQNIDNIVKAKLGMNGGTPAPRPAMPTNPDLPTAQAPQRRIRVLKVE